METAMLNSISTVDDSLVVRFQKIKIRDIMLFCFLLLLIYELQDVITEMLRQFLMSDV